MHSSSTNPLIVALPVCWSEAIDHEMEQQLKVLEAQSLALRWERFMHRMFEAWPLEIDAVSFRSYSIGSGQALPLEVDIEMPERMCSVNPSGRLERVKPVGFGSLGALETQRQLTSGNSEDMWCFPPGVVEIQHQMAPDQSGEKRALRRNIYENEVVQPFRAEICKAIAGQPFPVPWVYDVLDCRPSSTRRTREEWQERSAGKVAELVGHYRLAARLDTSLEQTPVRRPPRV